MAKKPKNYPVIPRDKLPKRNKDAKHVGAIHINMPVKVPRIMFANSLYKPFGSYTPGVINVNETYSVGNNERAGTKNPNWKQTIAAGGDAGSNYSRTVIRPKYTKYRIISEDASYKSDGYGSLFGSFLNEQRAYTDLEDQALGRLKERLKSKVGNAQLGPPLAESREIGRLVRQINGVGMQTFKSLLAAKETRGRSLAKQFGDIWLGFGFGVNPLLKDIKTAADSILHYVSRADRRVVVTGSASRRYTSGYRSDTSSSDYISSHCSMGWCYNANHWQGVRYVAGADITVRAGSNYSVADHLGLKVEALPSILWELTPYSWVVDYFTTVGSWLDDTFYTLPVTIKYLSKNYKYESDTTSTPVAITIPGAKSSLTGGNSFCRYTQFTREKLGATLPTRSLRFKTVDEIASHGLTKFLNLGSVLASRRGPKL